MITTNRYVLATITLALLHNVSNAAIRYLDNAARGANNGTNWANAWTNFGSIRGLAGGDTLYISGGTTSKTYYGQWNITSGSPGYPITYSVGQDAGHNGLVIFDSVGTNTYCIWIGPEKNWVITGNYGGSKHLILKNTGSIFNNWAIGGSGGVANGIIEYASIEDMGNGINFQMGNNMEIRFCDFLRMRSDHALAVGGANEVLDSIRIHHCSIVNYAATSGGNGPDGIQLIGPGVTIHDVEFKNVVAPGSTVGGQHPDAIQGGQNCMRIYNNIFHTFANASIEANPNARTGVWHDWYIYNNVFRNDSSEFTVPRCFECGENAVLSLVSNIFWINNTFADWPTCFGQDWANMGTNNHPFVVNYRMQNNLFYNSGGAWVIGFGHYINTNFNWGNVICSYNLINAGTGGGTNINVGGSSAGHYLTNQTSFPRNGRPTFVSYSVRSLSNDFHLALSDNAARGLGANLTTIFPDASTDKDGAPRSSVNAWAIGAYESTSGSTAAIAVTPASQAFGTIVTGAAADRNFTVQNTGSNAVSGAANVPAPFSIISGSPYSLGIGQSQVVTVRYAPTVAGTHVQSVTFTGGTGAVCSVTGVATNPPAPQPVIAVTPASQNFGSLTVGSSADRSFSVTNAGSGTLSGTASVPAPFSVISGSPYNLGAGQSQVVTVRYAPTSAGTNVQSVTFTGGAGAVRTVTGVATNPPSGQPVIAVTPASQDFGSVMVGSYADRSFTVRNAGSGTLSGTASVPAPFSIVAGNSYNLAAGQSQLVTVRYRPTASGSINQSVVFTGGGGATRAVTGSAYSIMAGLSFEAEAGLVTSPFIVTNGYIYQTLLTGVTNGGRASFAFTVSTAGTYTVSAVVDAPSDAANSFFVNIDAEPQDPSMVWDIPFTSGFESRTVAWRGSGTADQSEFVPKVFTLSQGLHQLIIRGREGGVRLDRIAVVKARPKAPTNLRVASTP